MVWPSNDLGIIKATGNDFDLRLYGSNTAPTGPTDGTQLYASGVITDFVGPTPHDITSGITTTTAYRYHWVAIIDTESHDQYIEEIELWETPATVNMTLVSNAETAEAQPDDAHIILFEEDVDAVTLNTDLKAYASRDGGTTWTQATLADQGDYETGKRILTGDADISGQPSGTSMKWKVETLNTKEQRIHGLALQWS